MATQRNSGGRGTRSRGSGRRQAQDGGAPATEQVADRSGEPDVLLDVPKLAVEEIGLEVDNLHARVALQARLADLVQLHVGVDVEVDRVALEIKGVEAQAQLKARLDNVLAIVERALETVDQHPELLTELARSTADATGALGEGAAAVASRGELGARRPERRRRGERLEAPDGEGQVMSSEPREVVDVVAGAGAEPAAGEPPADVEIDVWASAAEVRPLEHARTGSAVHGSGEVRRSDTVWRRNAPSRLEPGAVYRDVRIRRRIAGRLEFPRRRDG